MNINDRNIYLFCKNYNTTHYTYTLSMIGLMIESKSTITQLFINVCTSILIYLIENGSFSHNRFLSIGSKTSTSQTKVITITLHYKNKILSEP